jgi:adenylate cyclase
MRTRTHPRGRAGARVPRFPVTLNSSRLPRGAVVTARAAVLFADLRGYTRLAEQLRAESVVPLLDEFFTVLASTVANHGGEVFHLAGDGLMAGFGGADSVRNGDGAREALAAGREMLARFAPVAARWQEELGVDTGIGIGLHVGDVAVGRLGAPGRRSPTLVGDTVNVAARLCSRARAGELVFSAPVAAALAASGEPLMSVENPYLHLPHVTLRGRAEPLDIWCVPAAVRIPA